MIGGLRDTVDEFKRRLLLQTLMETGVNVAATARRLRVHYNTIGYLCRALNIDMEEVRKSWHSATMRANRAAENFTELGE